MNYQFEVPMKYKYSTRIGNWSEEQELEDDKMKDYLKKKENSQLESIKEQSKIVHSLQKASLTYSRDNMLYFENHIMLYNNKTEAYLAVNIWENILNATEESYSVTSTKKISPSNRSVFIIKRFEEDQYKDEIIRYGQKVTIIAHPRLLKNKELFLTSGHITPSRCSRFSRKQEVSVTVNKTFENVWVFEHIDPKLRYSSIGQPVNINSPLLLKHLYTAQWLATDDITFRNDFGVENEVFGHSFQTANKTRNLAAEKAGRITIDNPMRFQYDQNSWEIITARDKTEEFNEQTQEQSLTYQIVLDNLRKAIIQKGLYGVRKLSQIYYRLDQQKEQQMTTQNIINGLKEHGIQLSNKEQKILESQFDSQQTGFINYLDFIEAIKGNQNQNRVQAIQDAYKQILGTNYQINLEQLAQYFDSTKHLEVIRKFKSNQQVFKEFLEHWNEQNATHIISLEEFQQYYTDISSCIERDDVFIFMMASCFKKNK